MPEQTAIEDLAAAIADRADVDWAAAESSAGSDRERAVLRHLRRIGEIADAHRSGIATDPGPGAGDDERHWGHLRLLAKAGEGAFGEVYRAWDTKLDREVALKLLHPGAPEAGQAISTVLEEGRVLARVRHPNVVTVYGADRIDGRVGIWMDFIHGRTLEQMLAEQGVFSAREVILIGMDICRALAAVHAAGFIHRDVKASNVIRQDGGRIVLMDFGTGREHTAGGVTMTPGLVGTPLYAAPEVLTGGAGSVASDVYSLGTLLYHLVTATFPVAADTLADVHEAHRMGRRTRLRDARPDLPDGFVRVVERAIAEHPRARYDSAGAMEAALAGALDGESHGRRAAWLPWSLAAAFIVTSAAAVVFWFTLSERADNRVTTFFEATEGQINLGGHAPSFAISPDGSRVAYVAEVAGTQILFARALSESSPTELAHADHVISNPTFSPDGKSLAFYMRTAHDPPNTPKLCRVSVDGGPPVVLADDVAFGGRGIAWGADGTIIYVSGAIPNLWRTSDKGDAPRSLTFVKGTDATLLLRPQWLPNGSVLFTEQPRSGPPRAMALLSDGSVKTILDDANHARFVPPASLVFSRDQSLMGVRFDAGRLAVLGRPVQLGARPAGDLFDASASGSLLSAMAARPDAGGSQRLAWIERGGRRETPVALPTRRYDGRTLRLSPDGNMIAVAIALDDGDPMSISPRSTWIGDLRRGTLSLFAGDGTAPLTWGRDGRHITLHDANGGLSRKAIDDTSSEEPLKGPGVFGNAGEWTPDGRMLLVPGSRILTWSSAEAVGREEPTIDNTFSIGMSVPAEVGFAASFSPDGRWVAYNSVNANRIEVYARAFRAAGPVVRISTNGGQKPRWVGDEIFYWENGAPGRVVAVRTNLHDPRLGIGEPRVAAEVAGDEPVQAFDVTPDGRRFLILRGSHDYPARLRVVLNWIREVQGLLGM